MKISLLYTSRRPDQVAGTVGRWLHTADTPGNLEFVFTADGDDRMTALAMKHAVEFLLRNGVAGVGPFPSEVPGSAAKGWNLAGEKSTGDLLIAIADDFSAFPHWDTELRRTVDPEEQQEAVVLVGDGIKRDCPCATLPIITRKRYERLGYVYHPAYPSMWNDNELAEHAAEDGVLIDARTLCFEQKHYVNGKRNRDAVDAGHSSPWHFQQGRRTFEARKALHFPVDSGPRARLEARTEVFRPIAYILTAGDDFAVCEACARLLEEGVENFFFSIPDQLWNGCPAPDRSRLESFVQVLAGTPGVKVWRQYITVGKYRKGVELYADIEGRARNAALAEISELGFRDVLIVDDDELWPSGLLDEVARIVETDRPAYIHADALPVVGFPGLPVEGAKDRVGIYLDVKRNRFLSGRSPYRGGSIIEGLPVLHFTATRRSRDAIADKMRSSAHYNDPDYNFEGWLASTLPSLRPGSQNVHMYRKGVNVWPRLREWHEAEIKAIPPSLRQYLWRT